MWTRWMLLAPVLALLSLAAAAVNAAADSFEYCTVCHGANGNGNASIHAPRIAGLEPWYLEQQLTAFKLGWRGKAPDDAAGNEMRPIAEHLSLAQIDQAVAYVGSFAPKPTLVTVSGDIAHGKTIYKLCATCHGERGEGRQSVHAPALSMRTDWYLSTQLHNYRAGLRGTTNGDASGQQMRAIAAALPNDYAIDDVVAYINTLR